MYQVNRNQAEKIFNESNVISTKINQIEDNLCLVFDFSNGGHLQMNYKHPEGEKTYFIFEKDQSI